MTSLNRPHSGGGQLVWDRFPCSQQLHFHKPRGGKRQESEEEGQQQKDGEGAQREMTEMKKSAHNRERKLGPKASKVAKGEK